MAEPYVYLKDVLEWLPTPEASQLHPTQSHNC